MNSGPRASSAERSALGVKTSLGRIFAAGPGGLALVGVETLVVLAIALVLLQGFGIS